MELVWDAGVLIGIKNTNGMTISGSRYLVHPAWCNCEARPGKDSILGGTYG